MEFYKFKFEHCWKLLKDTAKWNNLVVVQNTTNAPKRALNPKSQTIDVENLGSPPFMNSTQKTPIMRMLHRISDKTWCDLRDGRRLNQREGENKKEKSILYLKSINETLTEATTIEK